MKIRLWSDVHLEFGPLKVHARPDDNETTLVIAGDFTVGWTHADLMAELCKQFKHVVYLPGNHEYYNNNVEEVNAFWSAFHRDTAEFGEGPKNFHFLNPGTVVLDGVRFIGATLWTDLFNADPLVMMTVAGTMGGGGMNDYRCIRMPNDGAGPYDKRTRTFLPADSVEINKAHRAFIIDELSKPFDGKTIVVSHHAPHSVCIHPKYQNKDARTNMFNFAYVNTGTDDLFRDYDFDLWFHGHIHDWQEHEVHGKKIIARPRGYIDYEIMASTYTRQKLDAEIIEV